MQEVNETKYEIVWDHTGRFVSVHGQKRSPMDRGEKNIKFYNIFGEPLCSYDKI